MSRDADFFFPPEKHEPVRSYWDDHPYEWAFYRFGEWFTVGRLTIITGILVCVVLWLAIFLR